MPGTPFGQTLRPSRRFLRIQQPVYQTGRTSRVPASEIFFERTAAGRFVPLSNISAGKPVQIILPVIHKRPAMTTIVLAHPNERSPRFQVFGIYEAPDVHHVFAVEEISTRDEAERVAHKMMK
jgi:hypothetical protein